MARYFLHLRDGTDLALDAEGQEFEGEAALTAGLLASVRDLMKGDVAAGRLDLRLRIDAETGDGRLVQSLAFIDAVRIIYPTPGPQQAVA